MSSSIFRAGLNKTIHLSSIGLALQAFYINMTIDQAHGGEHFAIKPIGQPIYSPAYYTNYFDGGNDIGKIAYDTLHSFADKGTHLGGFANHGGYYDGSKGIHNGYEHEGSYGAGHQHGQGSIVGGQYGQLGGRKKGHVASGFSTSYRKDERGDNSAYYDDGTGSGGHIIYAAHDKRFRNDGGDGVRGGYYDSSILKNDARNNGIFGSGIKYYDSNAIGHNSGYGGKGFDYGKTNRRIYEGPLDSGIGNYGKGYNLNYNGYGKDHNSGFGGYGKGYSYDMGYGKIHDTGLSGYGKGYGFGGNFGDNAKVLGHVKPAFGYGPLIKNSGVYVVPMPSKLYYD